jgi:hypothetical protein
MPKFKVFLTVTSPASTCIEVEAENVEDATDKAIDALLDGGRYARHDYDGNRVEIMLDDINIDEVAEED